ncbi:hypothetical protein GMRT_15308 [Giardia muris]|uniref:Uncharacterized protein n=1 Tax=Giardia muris TaxID=5742 RepID=A0A4Z1SZJ4_GIAMU|nr:hypothetical protein GMRT_15308 [Giardia muris]|eukprot:TNJ28888.1 hypothetical protein GMRT_15308 [Giardia muris]
MKRKSSVQDEQARTRQLREEVSSMEKLMGQGGLLSGSNVSKVSFSGLGTVSSSSSTSSKPKSRVSSAKGTSSVPIPAPRGTNAQGPIVAASSSSTAQAKTTKPRQSQISRPPPLKSPLPVVLSRPGSSTAPTSFGPPKSKPSSARASGTTTISSGVGGEGRQRVILATSTTPAKGVSGFGCNDFTLGRDIFTGAPSLACEMAIGDDSEVEPDLAVVKPEPAIDAARLEPPRPATAPPKVETAAAGCDSATPETSYFQMLEKAVVLKSLSDACLQKESPEERQARLLALVMQETGECDDEIAITKEDVLAELASLRESFSFTHGAG